MKKDTFKVVKTVTKISLAKNSRGPQKSQKPIFSYQKGAFFQGATSFFDLKNVTFGKQAKIVKIPRPFFVFIFDIC